MASNPNIHITINRNTSPVESLEYLENELTRYKEQRNALVQQTYPADQEEDKQLLLKFYNEKITEFEECIAKLKGSDSAVKNPVILFIAIRNHSNAYSRRMVQKSCFYKQ